MKIGYLKQFLPPNPAEFIKCIDFILVFLSFPRFALDRLCKDLSYFLTQNSVLFVEKVPKLLGRGKLARFAHLISFYHLTQTVPLPKPHQVH